MPDLNDLTKLFNGARALCTLSMLQGYWQMPFVPMVQPARIVLMPDGECTRSQKPLGVLNNKVLPGNNGYRAERADRAVLVSCGGSHRALGLGKGRTYIPIKGSYSKSGGTWSILG